MKNVGGKTSRTLVLFLTVVLIAAIVLVVVFSTRGRVEPKAGVLPITQGENLTISENGSAVLSLATTTPPSQLANLYKRSIDEMGENAFVSAFREGVENEYKILTGIDIKIVNSQISVGLDNETRIFVEATAQQASKFDTSENAWEIEVRPPEENEAAGFILEQMMFAQQMLKSLPENKNQKLDYATNIPIKLPDGATIINADELSGKVWKVDIGGGSYREASLSLVSSREVMLTERVVVTEQPPAAPNGDLFRALLNYRIFSIKYRLFDNVLGFAAAAIGDNKATVANPDRDFSWGFGWTVSYPFSQAFPYSTDGVSAEVDLTGTAEFTFNWYIGWDFAWEWDTLPTYKLQWFRAYVEINPQINLNASTEITAELKHEWEKDNIYNWSHPVTIFIGPLPVVIEVRVDIGAGVEVGVDANISINAGVDASTTFRLGVEWTKDLGWQPIAERNFTFTHTGPEITASAEAWVTPYLKLRLGAYFYWTAGPYVELEPLATATLTPENWSIEAGFDIDAGVGFGAIRDWIENLPDWSTTLYSWRTPIASGTIGKTPSGPPTTSASQHAPISINGNDQFTSANGVTGGSGAQSDPYIIQGWAIDASSTTGIDIQNTTVFFDVRNCLIENGNNSGYILVGNAGIYLYNVINGQIENNTCKNNGVGIDLDGSSNNIITGNTCENNSEYGISLLGTISLESSGNIIFLNYLLNNNQNAYDGGFQANSWDSNGRGNYWSDWQPPAVPSSNGIVVDLPRPIWGRGDEDHYPLVLPAVIPTTSSTFVSCSPNPVSVGSPVTCTVSVSGSNPTGTVAWSISSGTGYFSQSICILFSGSCSTMYTATSAGPVTITASYSGDSNNTPSSDSVTLVTTTSSGGGEFSVFPGAIEVFSLAGIGSIIGMPGMGNIPPGIQIRMYATTGAPDDILNYYRTEMDNAGWEKLSDNNFFITSFVDISITESILYFEKGDAAGEVCVLSYTYLDGSFTYFVLMEGPKATFENYWSSVVP